MAALAIDLSRAPLWRSRAGGWTHPTILDGGVPPGEGAGHGHLLDRSLRHGRCSLEHTDGAGPEAPGRDLAACGHSSGVCLSGEALHTHPPWRTGVVGAPATSGACPGEVIVLAESPWGP